MSSCFTIIQNSSSPQNTETSGKDSNIQKAAHGPHHAKTPKRKSRKAAPSESYYDTLLDFIAYYFLSGMEDTQKKNL